jgi:serine phosphatase RsbU (regulator of sigma subunit)
MDERILIVEDTPANIQILTGILKERGYRLSIATDGRRALDALEQVRPDLILLDVMMPGIDGYETCRRIKSSAAWKDIPIIFLTAKSETPDIVKGFDVGAVDYVAKPFNAHELLARIGTHLTIDHLRRSLAEKNEQLALAHKRELEMAFRVQSQLIPTQLPRHPGWDFAARWQPAREVSGDYYDFIPKGERLGVVIADVSGKGMHAALFMASTRSIIRARATLPLAPREIIDQANTLLCQDAAQGMFVTLFYAEFDPGTRRMAYVNAGHNPPFWYRADRRSVTELEPTGSVLGFNEPLACEEKVVEPGPGDVLLFYTDGYSEAFDESGRQFGEDRLKEVLAEHSKDSPQEILAEIQTRLDAFVGAAPQSDDRTMVIAKCLG